MGQPNRRYPRFRALSASLDPKSGFGIFGVRTSLELTNMAEREKFWSGWRERLSALRNVPPVLRIVWESGPVVVSLGLIFRLITSLIPIVAPYPPASPLITIGAPLIESLILGLLVLKRTRAAGRFKAVAA